MYAYDYKNNNLVYRRPNGQLVDLQLRKHIILVRGLSGSGKSMIVDDLIEMKKLDSSVSGYNLSNVNILSDVTDLGIKKMDNSLIMIDRADMILTDEACEWIRFDTKNQYIIFARGSYNLGVSPNYIGELVFTNNIFQIMYKFSERGWF